MWILHTNTIHSRIDKLHGPQTSELPSSVAEIDEKFLQEGMPHTLTLGIRTCKSDRMVVQQGGFSVSRSVLGEHGEIIGQAIPENDEVFLFAKLIIPSNLKLTFLRKLRNVNITGGSLFPGLDGLARSVAELVMLGGK